MIRVETSTADRAYIVQNLYPLYLHDLSEYTGDPANEHGVLAAGSVANLAAQAHTRELRVWWERPRELHPLDESALTPADRDAQRALEVMPSWMAYLYEHDRLWPSDPSTALVAGAAHVSIQAP